MLIMLLHNAVLFHIYPADNFDMLATLIVAG